MSKYKLFLEYIIIAIWLLLLFKTDSVFSVYLFVGIIAAYCATYFSTSIDKSHIAISSLFSLMVTASNYNLYTTDTGILDIIVCILIFMLGIVPFYNISYTFPHILKKISWKSRKCSISNKMVFWLSFVIMFIIYSFIMFFCRFPGELSFDSIVQLNQSFDGHYTNHHPVFHTLLIKFIVEIGLKAFGGINAAIALYSLIQIAIISGIFSFAIMTIYQKGKNIKIAVIVWIYFLLMPYNIVYSFTMWKDIIWSSFIVLLAVSIYRTINKIGYSTFLNIVFTFISSVGICIFRNNGFYVIILTSIIWAIVLQKEKKIGILLPVVIAIIISSVLEMYVMDAYKVSKAEIVESLAIPMQQISLVVHEEAELKPNEKYRLGLILDLDRLKKEYNPYNCNYIKYNIWDKGNENQILKNKKSYLKIYLRLALRHPCLYLRAWIDQTKGYWNGGYDYWITTNNVFENDLGIRRTVYLPFLGTIFDKYCNAIFNIDLLKPLSAIGLFMWINILVLFYALKNRKKDIVLMSIPTISVAFTLVFAAPVYAEFRYIYSLFCLVPIIISLISYEEELV